LPALSPHFQCVLDRAGRLDTLTVKVERRPEAAPADGEAAGAQLASMVKNGIGVTVAVEVIEPHGVERSMGKMRRIVDNRQRQR
jgi:phenylacetate-CoA ligase